VFIGVHTKGEFQATPHIPEDDAFDSQSDNDEDDDVSEDEEEVFKQHFDITRAEAVAEGTKAQQIESALRRQGKAPRLRNLRGEWLLYFSALIDCIKRYFWDDSPGQIAGYELGTMEIGTDKIERAGTDLSADLMLIYSGESDFVFDLKMPKYASATPLHISCYLTDAKYVLPNEMSFLGSGTCKTAFEGYRLGTSLRMKTNLCWWRCILRRNNSLILRLRKRVKSGRIASIRGICIPVDGGSSHSIINVSILQRLYRKTCLDTRI
jgi:hypothetical protein